MSRNVRTDTPETGQCERALKASEAKYRTFFETVHDAAFLADVATGRILEANSQAQNLLGWSLDEFRTKTYLDILVSASREEGKRLFELDNKEIAGKTYELTLRHRDGTPVPVQGSTMLYVDETGRCLSFGVFHDLRERRGKEAALQLEEARLEAVLKLNQMPATNFDTLAEFALEEAVRLTSSSYGFLALLSADGTTASLYCLSKSALRDCRMPVLPTQLNVKMSGVRAEAIRRRKPVLLNGLPGDGVGDLTIPDGHVPINRLLLTPILDRENVVLLAGVANKETLYDDSDVRQLTLLMSEMWSVYTRRKAEEEGRQLESQMKHVQKLESLGVLAGGIAHDFNNILMAILGHVDLVRMSLPSDHEIQGHLEPIVTASKRAAELCRQMLAYAGKSYTERKNLQLNDLIREMSKIIEVSVSKKAVVDYRLGDGLPEIEADPAHVRQVLLNLLTNASESLENKPGTIIVQTKKMECDQAFLAGISLEKNAKEGCYVALEISDTGCGMDSSIQERMFDPFFTTKFTGRGLGLAAVLGIVRGHHGAIRVYSKQGNGTTFCVFLPAVGLGASPSRPKCDISAWRSMGTILLADDEAEIRRVASMMLSYYGFKVIIAKDGREAVELCRQRGAELTAVMLDLTMPHLDGYEVHLQVKKQFPRLPVILMSGYTEGESTRQFATDGLAGFLQKPFEIRSLGEKLRSILEP